MHLGKSSVRKFKLELSYRVLCECWKLELSVLLVHLIQLFPTDSKSRKTAKKHLWLAARGSFAGAWSGPELFKKFGWVGGFGWKRREEEARDTRDGRKALRSCVIYHTFSYPRIYMQLSAFKSMDETIQTWLETGQKKCRSRAEKDMHSQESVLVHKIWTLNGNGTRLCGTGIYFTLLL